MVRVADEIIAASDVKIEYMVGTMIEIPRACVTADEVAKEADFFSYYEKNIYESDPFARLDQKGIGKLVETAVKLGRSEKPTLKLGVCGEHGGDPSSIEFFHKVGLDYVSCSPFRVPIARLAAAQAALKFPRA